MKTRVKHISISTMKDGERGVTSIPIVCPDGATLMSNRLKKLLSSAISLNSVLCINWNGSLILLQDIMSARSELQKRFLTICSQDRLATEPGCTIPEHPADSDITTIMARELELYYAIKKHLRQAEISSN